MDKNAKKSNKKYFYFYTDLTRSTIENAMKFHVLALHGWQENAEIMNKKTLKLQNTISDTKFDFINATYIDPQKSSKDATFYSWLELRENNKYEGWQESLLYVMDYIHEHGPYDGIMCFSQGSLIAVPLLALHTFHAQKKTSEFLYQEVAKFRSPEKWFLNQPPFKFIIIIGGFVPQGSRASSLRPAYENMFISTPSMHVMGKNDKVISRKYSEELVDKFNARTRVVHVHKDGHIIPNDEMFEKQLKNFLKQFEIVSKL
jgi:hypothetical protein